MNLNDLKYLKKKLPKTPGILRKDEYFNSAVLIPLVLINNEFNFLFEKRAATIRQGGEICFPGGEFDHGIDKSFRDTAVRETIEELGINREKITVIGALDTLIGPMGVTVDSFIGTIDITDISELNYDQDEVEEIFMIPVSHFQYNPPVRYEVRLEIHPNEVGENGVVIETLPVKELNLPKRYSKPWKGRKHGVLVYKYGNNVIWGITAALIYEVIEKLKSKIFNRKT